MTETVARPEAVTARAEAVTARTKAVAARAEAMAAWTEAVTAGTESVTTRAEAVAARTKAVTARGTAGMPAGRTARMSAGRTTRMTARRGAARMAAMRRRVCHCGCRQQKACGRCHYRQSFHVFLLSVSLSSRPRAPEQFTNSARYTLEPASAERFDAIAEKLARRS
jgi:hypothetical protein